MGKRGDIMYNLNDIVVAIDLLFETTFNDSYYNESGLTFGHDRPIKRIGYCTNLTPDVVEKAMIKEIDLLITHHDAWDFLGEIKDEAYRLLREYKISHYFNHLPLDDAKFGTNSSLLKKLDTKELSKHCNEDGFLCGALGETHNISFEDLKQKLENITEENVMGWKFNDKPINNVFVVCGAGFTTDLIDEALENKADVYITGEKILYTVEYAKQKNINLLVGSHTFTELFGVESLVYLLKNQFKDLELIKIEEEHLESAPLNK